MKILNDKKTNILLGLFIIIQLAVVFYWGSNKANYYVDELYSKGYANSFTGEGDTAQYITTSPDWRFGEWIKNSELKKHIVVSEKESVFNAKIGNTISHFITWRFYFGLLNIMESLLGSNDVSIWPGIILNSLILILTDVALVILLRRLKLQNIFIILAFLMFGFSGYIIGITEFIRFYSIVILLLLLLWNTLIQLWDEKDIKKTGIDMLILGVLVHFSYKHSELTILYAGILLFFFTLALLLTKKYFKALFLLAIEAIGIIYIYLNTDFIDILIHPDAYSSDWKPVNYINNILKADFSVLKKNIMLFKDMLNEYYFGNQALSVAIASLLIVCVIYRLIKTKKNRDCSSLRARQRIIETILVSIGLLCCIIASLTINIEIFWISFIILSACLLLEVVHIVLNSRRNDNSKGASNTIFVGLLAITMIPYVVLVSLSGYTASRYFCFAIVSVMIGLWYMIDRVFYHLSTTSIMKAAYISFAVCAMISIIYPFSNRNIEYVYEDEKEFNIQIKKNSDIPVVNAYYGRHDLYDCVYRMSDDTDIYFIDCATKELKAKELPSSFILWSHRLAKLEWLKDDFEKRGYLVRFLGKNHVSQAYLCEQR